MLFSGKEGSGGGGGGMLFSGKEGDGGGGDGMLFSGKEGGGVILFSKGLARDEFANIGSFFEAM